MSNDLPWLARQARSLREGLFCGLLGCGSLVGTDYRGTPLLTIEGEILSDGSVPASASDNVAVAMLWSVDLEAPTDQQSVVASTSFPSRYRLAMYHPPPSRASQQILGQPWLEGLVGQPALFRDLDGDGTWDSEVEPQVGGAFDRAILWVTRRDEPPAEFDWAPSGLGFHIVDVEPRPCEAVDETSLGLLEVAEGVVDLRMTVLPQWRDWDCDGDDELTCELELPPGSLCAIDENLPLDDPDEMDLFLGAMLVEREFDQCLSLLCPETVERLMDAVCPPRLAMKATCSEITADLDQPTRRQERVETLQADESSWWCLSRVCPAVIDELFAEG